MARELRHPLTGDLYGVDPASGLVRVCSGDKVGIFDYQGKWRDGERFQVDPEMCNWIGGPNANGAYGKPYKTI
jgi:hypothetical protein